MLRRMPTETSATTRLEPPYDTKGSGIPVSGASPITAARLIAAWPHTSTVRPAASRLPKGSLQLSAIRRPKYANAPYAAMTAAAPMSPSSSPMIAKIMSVCASGRKFAFSMLWPRPRPKTPPEPRPMIACTVW